jgi:hypothetical protein
MQSLLPRRRFLHQLAAGAGVAAWPLLAQAQAQAAPLRVAGGWRMNEREYQIGALRIDWAAGEVHTEFAVTMPTLPHAIVPEAGGGFLAVATRPGTWIVRADAQGRIAQQLTSADEGERRTFDGHVIASHDGQWLYTGETDRKSGEGWVSVRDARDLRKVAEHRTHGIDPHQILVDARGRLVIANGGIPRTATGLKRDLDRMNPILVLLDPASGAKLGEWTLPDARLSPHHIAWSRPRSATETPLLGIGLQAEHDAPSDRRDAPLLAVWDGQALTIPSRMVVDGYAGDVAPGPNGGFVLTAQRANRIVLWQPHQPAEFTTIGKVQNPCGLWPLADAPGVAIGGGLGLARWHPTAPASMLRWPAGMAAGNHWALLA